MLKTHERIISNSQLFKNEREFDVPGIFGSLNCKHESIDNRTALKMARDLKHEEWFSCDWIVNPCLLGVVEFNKIKSKNIVNDPLSNIYGVSKGQIYNKKEISDKFDVGYDNNYLNDIYFIKNLYNKIGLNFPKFLNGIFSIALYDEKKDNLIVVNDRYGFYPIFYFLDENGFMFASEGKVIFTGLKFKPTIDKNAISEFLTFSFPIGNRTFFSQLKRLPPATILIYNGTKNKLVKKRYWSLKKSGKKQKNVDKNHYIKLFKKIMKKTIKNATCDKNEIGIFLSGGLDSTILTAFASETNTDIITFTFGHRDCYSEKQIAKTIADELGVENIFFEIPSNFIEKLADKIVYQGEGLIRIRESHLISCLDKVREKTDTVLMGTLGEILRKKIRYRARNIRRTIIIGKRGINEYFRERRFRHLPLYKYPIVFNKQFYQEAAKGIIKDYKNAFELIGGLHARNINELFLNWRFQIGFSSGLAQQFQYLNWYLETRHPFMDNNLFNFAHSLPRQWLEGNRFINKAMKYCFPKLCNIQLEHGASFNTNPLGVYMAPRIVELIRRIRGKKNRPNAFDYRAYGHWIRSGSRDFIIKTLRNSKYLYKYFNMEYINKILEDHMNLKNDNNKLICDLINLELLHRIFFPDNNM